MGDPDVVGSQADALVSRIEKTMQRRRAGTETLRLAWAEGRLKHTGLPCHSRCDGNIVATVDGHKVTGFCPVYMEKNICPLVKLAERELYARLTRSGFGPQYHTPDPQRIRPLEALNEYLAHLRVNLSQGRGLILSGEVGVGKTMALGYLARHMLDEDIGVWKVHMPILADALIDREKRRPFVERALKVQVLMLDDFGSGDMPSWVLGILEGIVEHRYSDKKPVILTTNLDRGTLVRVPEFRRMVDRWRETCRWIGIGGASQRHEPDAR